MTYVYDDYIFHYIVDCGICYLSMSDEKHKHRIPFAFLDDIKTDFVNNITHELRTPLTLIMGPVEKLMDQVKKESLQRQLRIVDRNGKLLYNLINQLLDLSKIETGNMSLRRTN